MFNNGYTSSDGRFKASFQQDKVLKGEDGFSPIVKVEEIEDGHRIHITDKESTYSFDVMNGEIGPVGPIGPQGEQGIQGPRGEQGYTPYIGTNGNWWVGDTDTGIYTNISVLDVVELPTKNINEGIIYRLLEGKLVTGALPRNDCTCRIVKWGKNNKTNRPEKGENLLKSKLLTDVGGYVVDHVFEASLNVYYNIDTGDLYGYFDNDSASQIRKYIQKKYTSNNANTMINSLNSLINNYNGWVSIKNLFDSGAGILFTKLLFWEKAINNLSEVVYKSSSYLYLYVYNTTYKYNNGAWTSSNGGIWIRENKELINPGEGNASTIMGYIKNIASGDASLVAGGKPTKFPSILMDSQNAALGDNSFVGGFRCVAYGDNTIAFGKNLLSTSDNSASFGQYNVGKTNTIFEVGVGNAQESKNAMEIETNGNINFYSKVIFNEPFVATQGLNLESDIDKSFGYRLMIKDGTPSLQYITGQTIMHSSAILTEQYLKVKKEVTIGQTVLSENKLKKILELIDAIKD